MIELVSRAVMHKRNEHHLMKESDSVESDMH